MTKGTGGNLHEGHGHGGGGRVGRPLPPEITECREVHDGYAIVEVQSANMTEPLRLLETDCAGSCAEAYRITAYDGSRANPTAFFLAMRAALDRGDRSLVTCYHSPKFAAFLRR